MTAKEYLREAAEALRPIRERAQDLSPADGVKLFSILSAVAMALALDNVSAASREELEATICETAREYRAAVRRLLGEV